MRQAVAGAAALALALGLTSSGPAQATNQPAGPPKRPIATSELTLVTGDRVQVSTLPDGTSTYGVRPAKGREDVGFFHGTRKTGGGAEHLIVPTDAAPLLAKGRLDKDLFNVTKLHRDGFTNQRSLPLILTYDGDVDAVSQPLVGTERTRKLRSINGLAVAGNTNRIGQFWKSLTTGGLQPNSGAKLEKVWLDQVYRPVLDESAAQVGAPEAWKAGFTGKDVVIADIDTGYDPAHPDLADRVVEAVDFTKEGGNAIDDHGHGTHTAGTIAGTGAASAGKYQGIAPDAKLLIGKVCDKNGECSESAVIAAMEWAANKGAKAANLSLGGEASDGTDPIDQALNKLTETKGTLFVCAAGNDGVSVASPGAADKALTVGSVNKQDALSKFSGRGPRKGDRAIKPDLVAPGEEIAAARAKGTSMGKPVDDSYTRASGTSMSTPHVTGAVAVLAQKHPDWSADELKAALMGGAAQLPNLTVHEQGSGRLELRKLLDKPVHATTHSLSFGQFTDPPNQKPVTAKVNYRNTSDTDVTLDLALANSGPAAPDGLFTLGAQQLTVPAKGNAAVTVTATPSHLVPGDHGAILTATAGDHVVRTPMAASAEKSPNLTVKGIDPHGNPSLGGLAFAVNTETGWADFIGIGSDGKTVDAGTYDITALLVSRGPDGKGRTESTAVSKLAVPVSKEGTEITLDGRGAEPVTARVDRPGASIRHAAIAIDRATTPGDGIGIEWLGSFALAYAVPIDEPTPKHRWSFRPVVEGKAADGRPYRYHLGYWRPSALPEPTTFYTPDRELARFDTTYSAQGMTGTTGLEGNNGKHPDWPDQVIYAYYDMDVPSERIEYFTAEPVNWWRLRVLFGPDGGGTDAVVTARESAGVTRTSYHRPPVGPAWGDGSRWPGITRTGNELQLGIQPYAPQDGKRYWIHYGTGSEGKTTLSKDGTVIGTDNTVGWSTFTLPEEKGTYTLTTSGTRDDAGYSNLHTTTTAEWTFESAATTEATRLPLSLLRLAIGKDRDGRDPQNELGQLRAGSRHALNITADHQLGSTGASTRDVSLEVSYDEGKTWKPVRVVWIPDLQRGAAAIAEPDTPGFVSLRSKATNADGSTVTQTINRAYELIK
ncbi:S8 family serine peptidase [Streptomyces sp. KR80]|uniref:S8 family serine peptidase n=1 Tax=Streptomyces sp. KR80 TaxID=3457426 RepID=UPI003FCEF0CD